MLTLVTGSDHTYFNELKQLLDNIIQIIKDENHSKIKINVVVYDLGMNKIELDEIKLFSNIIL